MESTFSKDLITTTSDALAALDGNDRDSGPCLLPARSLDFLPAALPASLTPATRQVLEAVRQGKRIGEVSREGMNEMVRNIFATAKVRLGHKGKADKEELYAALQIISDLRTHFFGLTPAEVFQALERGLNGRYKQRPEEVVFFSPSALVQWLEAYVSTTKPEAFLQLTAASKPEPEPEKTEKESLQIVAAGLVRHYEQTLADESYEFDDPNSIYYKLLERVGLLRITNEEKAAIWKEEEAKALAEAAYKASNPQLRSEKRNAIRSCIEELEKLSAKASEGNTVKHDVVKACRLRSLRSYLAECRAYKVNLAFQLQEAIDRLL